MNKSAILHIPVSQYAFALSEDTLMIRLRAGKNDLDACTLFFGDRACKTSPVTFSAAAMKKSYQDELFDFYEVMLRPCPKRVCYYFRLERDSEWHYYYADAFHQELPDLTAEDGFVIEGRSEYYQYPYILRSEILRLPEWFLNAAVYNIFPDSFASRKKRLSAESKTIPMSGSTVCRSRLGGTLRGIIENLDYICNLGFNCLYLNPIFRAGEYHKYDTLDYFHIDPCMGTDDDFLELTQKVHERGMHIIIDGVFNHCGWHFPQFEDAAKKGEASRYKDWFYELDFPVLFPENDKEIPGYACFAYERKMPKFNTANPEVQEYFAQVGRYWIEKFHVDGWRLDVANEIDKNFWRHFRRAVKTADSNTILIGEVWENAEAWLKGDLFDSVMNYDFRKHCRDFFALDKTGPEGFSNGITDMMLRYPVQVSYGQLNLLDSHDVARFYSLCQEDYGRWQAAFMFLCLAPGVPCVFYGDERQISGVRETDYRKAMPWEKDCADSEEFVREALKIRKNWISPLDSWNIPHNEMKDNLFLFERKGKHHIRLLVNQGNKSIKADCGNGQILYQKGLERDLLQENGFAVLLMPQK